MNSYLPWSLRKAHAYDFYRLLTSNGLKVNHCVQSKKYGNYRLRNGALIRQLHGFKVDVEYWCLIVQEFKCSTIQAFSKTEACSRTLNHSMAAFRFGQE
jgi:hypothetical protein